MDEYRPPTKLREDNVFSRVCPSFCPRGQEGGSHVTITHGVLVLHLTLQAPSLGPAPLDMGLHCTVMFLALAPSRHGTVRALC